MEKIMDGQRNKIHPYKFNLWIALGAIIMMFAGLTSAYIVKRAQANWISFQLPQVFWFSTAVILVSSVTVQLAVRNFKDRQMGRYKKLITVTAILGLVFILAQWTGFQDLYNRGIRLDGNVAGSFLFVITGVHMLHVLGGVIALLIMFARAYRTHIRFYDAVPVEVAATYWHFVDVLWIYLFIFFIWIQ